MSEPFVPLRYHVKAKLAVECMDSLLSLQGCGKRDEEKKIIEYWKSKTCKPFDKEEFYRSVEASVAHLRRPSHSWD